MGKWDFHSVSALTYPAEEEVQYRIWETKEKRKRKSKSTLELKLELRSRELSSLGSSFDDVKPRRLGRGRDWPDAG
jgi:hypothetical protein